MFVGGGVASINGSVSPYGTQVENCHSIETCDTDYFTKLVLRLRNAKRSGRLVSYEVQLDKAEVIPK